MYYIFGNDGIVGNIDHLKEISVQMTYTWEHMQKVVLKLWKMFFSSPYNIDFLKPLDKDA